MQKLSPVIYSVPADAKTLNETDYRLVYYTLFLCLLSYFSIAQVGMSDFSSLEEDHFMTFEKDTAESNFLGLHLLEPQTESVKRTDFAPSIKNSYRFEGIASFDKSVNLYRISELSQDDFKKMIIESTPRMLRRRLIRHLDIALEMAQKHKVDPFWVLAVIWTESHFNENAESLAQAKGLMQLMPKTSEEISRKLRIDLTEDQEQSLIKDPRNNIEMGVYYLRYLQKRFWHSPFVATIAYNMGPSWVQWSLDNKKRIGNRNQYLNKVSVAYQHLSSRFYHYTLLHQRPFTDTYVAMNPPTHQIHTALDIEFSTISSL